MELRPRRRSKAITSAMLPAGVTFPWCKLPSLVQDIILGELAGDCDGGSTQGGEARAAYAAVCSDWQAFFEKISFRKLVLHDGDLDYFEEIVKRRVKSEKTVRRKIRGQQAAAVLASTKSRMPRIQHIWLRAELLNYDCWYCKVPQTPKEVVRYAYTTGLERELLLTRAGTTSNLRNRFGSYWTFCQGGRERTPTTGSSSP